MSLTDKAVIFEGTHSRLTVFPRLCKGCGLCIEKCPVKTLAWSDNLGVYGTPLPQVTEEIGCMGCGMCQIVCPDAAISVGRVKRS